VEVEANSDVLINVSLAEIKIIWMGYAIRTPFKEKTPLIKQFIDTAFKKFSVYPNPITVNSVFTIETKKMEKGDYTLGIISIDGEVVQTNNVIIEKKPESIKTVLNNLAAGSYFMRLTNKKSGKSYSEKIIVQ
jgi:hypothetical protein